ncbi:hypothetical protein KG088_11145 [Halomonas sp. TRM85114]|uniref:hypothetical protein n=1 Tax=Halomonas jincaotanensis TaxID=2810616 RepID=UPI001BD5BC23|nr:hypothetical protein [Halomonas jincaotanensis]MBS9404186.1 hypothetical protein [Halomonas jincaotanensis]
MMTRPFEPLRPAVLGACLLLPATTALAHSGHGAPSVHAHTGSPAMLVVLGIAALGVAALVPLLRLVLRRRRLRCQTRA